MAILKSAAARKKSAPEKKAPAAKKTAAAKKAPVAKKTRRVRRVVDAATVQEIFTRFQQANPEPKGELEHVNAFTLLVAVVLSAQATDVGVNKATRPLFAIADTPQKMLALGEDRFRDYI